MNRYNRNTSCSQGFKRATVIVAFLDNQVMKEVAQNGEDAVVGVYIWTHVNDLNEEKCGELLYSYHFELVIVTGYEGDPDFSARCGQRRTTILPL